MERICPVPWRINFLDLETFVEHSDNRDFLLVPYRRFRVSGDSLSLINIIDHILVCCFLYLLSGPLTWTIFPIIIKLFLCVCVEGRKYLFVGRKGVQGND